MTEQLKTLMDRAATQDFAAVDLDAITSAGDRTVRRRRVATGVAGVAVLAVIGTTAVLLGGNGDGKADVVDDPFRTDVPMWTEGSTLHTPDQTYDLGLDVYSFVRTSEGIVFMGLESDDVFGVYSFEGGEPARIGETDDPHLRADADEPYAGWLDRSGDDQAVIYDQSSGERTWTAPADVAHSFPIVAIDSGRAYLAEVDEGPTRVLDIESGQVTQLPEQDRQQYFMDVEGDLAAYFLETPGGRDLGITVGPFDEHGIEILSADAGGAVISPGGRWVSTSGSDIDVYETATGEAVELGAAGELEGYGYEWVDADTLMVAAEADYDNDVLQLMSCEVPAGACTVLLTIADFDQIFSIGYSDLLWGLTKVESSGSASSEMVASPANTERPE